MKPVANSQKRKLWVSLMVLKHQYVLLLALVQAQKGPTAEGRKHVPSVPTERGVCQTASLSSQMPSDRLMAGSGFLRHLQGLAV